jgi:hypothetical protein
MTSIDRLILPPLHLGGVNHRDALDLEAIDKTRPTRDDSPLPGQEHMKTAPRRLLRVTRGGLRRLACKLFVYFGDVKIKNDSILGRSHSEVATTKPKPIFDNCRVCQVLQVRTETGEESFCTRLTGEDPKPTRKP